MFLCCHRCRASLAGFRDKAAQTPAAIDGARLTPTFHHCSECHLSEAGVPTALSSLKTVRGDYLLRTDHSDGLILRTRAGAAADQRLRRWPAAAPARGRRVPAFARLPATVFAVYSRDTSRNENFLFIKPNSRKSPVMFQETSSRRACGQKTLYGPEGLQPSGQFFVRYHSLLIATLYTRAEHFGRAFMVIHWQIRGIFCIAVHGAHHWRPNMRPPWWRRDHAGKLLEANVTSPLFWACAYN